MTTHPSPSAVAGESLHVLAVEAGLLDVPLCLVGGAVRDELLGASPRDRDLVAEAPPPALSRLLERLGSRPGWRLLAWHPRFGTGTLLSDEALRLDLAMARRETYPRPGVLPVVEGPVPLHVDLARRDFTVHAMARRLGADGEGALVDPHGGRRDLALRRLALLHPGSLADDPTRAFRAARYAGRLGFTIEESGFGDALERSRRAGAWTNVSGDRLRRSIEELLREEDAAVAAALREIRFWGILADVVPGWNAATVDPEGVASAPTLVARWRRLLPAAPALRRQVASRLAFPKRMVRALEEGRG